MFLIETEFLRHCFVVLTFLWLNALFVVSFNLDANFSLWIWSTYFGCQDTKVKCEIN